MDYSTDTTPAEFPNNSPFTSATLDERPDKPGLFSVQHVMLWVVETGGLIGIPDILDMHDLTSWCLPFSEMLTGNLVTRETHRFSNPADKNQ